MFWNDSQGVNFVSFVFGERDVFDVTSFGSFFETHKDLGVLRNVIVAIRSYFVTIRMCLDRPIIVELVET